VALELVYDIGDRPTITATFTPNPDVNPPLDMDGFFKVRAPNGTQATYDFIDPEVTQVSTFVWRLQLPVLDQAGNWAVHAIGSDGIEAGEELTFTVRETTVVQPLTP